MRERETVCLLCVCERERKRERERETVRCVEELFVEGAESIQLPIDLGFRERLGLPLTSV